MAGETTGSASAAIDDAFDAVLEETAATGDDSPKTDAKTPAKSDNADAKPAQPAKSAEAPDSPKTDAKSEDKGPAPWEKDLAERGLDDPRYSEYHREVTQPYITQLEQGVAQYKEIFGDGDDALDHAFIAANVLNSLDQDPLGTLLDLVHDLELDPSEVARALGAAPQSAEAQPADGEPAKTDETDPDKEFLSQLREERETAAATEAYQALVEELKAEVPDFDETKWHVAMRATQGDAREAWEIYTQITATPEVVEPEPDPDPAPPVIGGGAGSTAAPSVKEPRTIDDALEDWLAEEKASRAR